MGLVCGSLFLSAQSSPTVGLVSIAPGRACLYVEKPIGVAIAWELAGLSLSPASLCLINTWGLPFWLMLLEAGPDPRPLTGVPGHWELGLMLIPVSPGRHNWWAFGSGGEEASLNGAWRSQTMNFTLGYWLRLSRNQRTTQIWVVNFITPWFSVENWPRLKHSERYHLPSNWGCNTYWKCCKNVTLI